MEGGRGVQDEKAGEVQDKGATEVKARFGAYDELAYEEYGGDVIP